jgi:hypothetical protein
MVVDGLNHNYFYSGNDVNEERPIYFGLMNDPSQVMLDYVPDSIYEKLLEEILNPDIMRSQVITLHLYIEYWLDKLLQKIHIDAEKFMLCKKVIKLNEAGAFEAPLYKNLLTVNKLRNIYAHELDLVRAATEVKRRIKDLTLDPYFITSDTDQFRSVCVQTMFLLEATYNNGCKPPKLLFPTDDTRKRLLETGKLHWQECELLSKTGGGYIVDWMLRCPLCVQGSIKREKDSTPGLKDSSMWPCDVCGLSGDGVYVNLNTAKLDFRDKSRVD